MAGDVKNIAGYLVSFRSTWGIPCLLTTMFNINLNIMPSSKNYRSKCENLLPIERIKFIASCFC